MTKKKRIMQVCVPKNCDNKPMDVEVGNKNHTICCEKGFRKSLEDFQEHLKKILK